MSSSDIITVMLVVCVALVALMLFSNPLKSLARVAVHGAVGALGMLTANTLLAPFGVFVGLNLATLLIVGVLGIPGFFMLYVTSAIFG